MTEAGRFAKGLQRLLRPKTVAILGGGGWGNEVARQLRKFDFPGEVWPVHPEKDVIQGYRCYKSIAALPAAPDASFIAVNRELTIDMMRQLNARGAGGAICFAAGFKEAGGKGDTLHKALLDAAGDMPFLGPNCFGLVNYLDGAALWPDQHGGSRTERGVALISQSGNIAINLSMQQRALPVSYLFALGNQARVGFSGLIEALLEDERVTAIGLVMEAVDDVAGFDQAARLAWRKRVPIAVLKLGSSARGAEAAMSHTASLAGSDQSVDAFFARLGIARVRTLPALLDTVKLLHFAGPLHGRDIVSISCSGGEATLMADLLEGRSVQARPFTPEQKSTIQATLSDLVTVANPLDYHTFIWGQEDRMTATFTEVMKAKFDLACFILDFPRLDRCSIEAWKPTIRSIAAASRNTGRKAVLVASIGEGMPESEAFKAATIGVGSLSGMSEAIEAAEGAARVGESYARGEPMPVAAPVVLKGIPEALDEWQGKQALRAFGLAVPVGHLVADEDSAAAAFKAISGPVVVKACSRTLLHKTEAGGVRVGLTSETDVRQAIKDMARLADRFIVEEVVADAVAELIIGVSRDSQFGPVVVLGAGGVLVELLSDSRTLLLPMTDAEIRAALDGLKSAKLLQGFRGKPAGDIDAVVTAVQAVGRFVQANAGRLAELDINPLMVRPKGRGVVAADVLLRQGA